MHTVDGSARAPLGIALAVVSVIVSFPALAAAQEHTSSASTQLVPLGGTVEADTSETRWPLLASGIAALGAGWVANGLVSLGAGQCGPELDLFGDGTSCRADPEWDPFRLAAALPVGGPFLQLALKPGSLGNEYWAPWLAVDGAIQVAGITMIVVALVSPRDSAEKSDDSPTIVPSVGPDHAGLAAVGRF